MRTVACLVFFAVLVPVSAQAQAALGSDDPRWERPFTFAIAVGLGTPVGFGGVTFQYNPVKYIGLVGGAGASNDGAQGMLALRPRMPVSHEVAMDASAGWSVGRYEEDLPYLTLGVDHDSGPDPSFEYAAAHWLNLDLGLTARTEMGIHVRGFVGFAQLMNTRSFHCKTNGRDDDCDDPTPPEVELPFLGAEFGGTF